MLPPLKRAAFFFSRSKAPVEEEEKANTDPRRWLRKHGIFHDADGEALVLAAVQEDGEGRYRGALQVGDKESAIIVIFRPRVWPPCVCTRVCAMQTDST